MNTKDITAIILAGGEGRRMNGQDKGLISLDGSPLIELQINKFSPFVNEVIISANRNLASYEHYGHKVVTDNVPLYQGPMAGITAGLQATRTEYAFIIACDMPQVPGSIVERLYQHLHDQKYDLAVAHDGERIQPLCMLLRKTLTTSLGDSLSRQALKITTWLLQQRYCQVDCSDLNSKFCNLNNSNTMADLVLSHTAP